MPLQATSGAASYDAFGGGAAAVPQYIEEVFSTYVYPGTGGNQTITNGIDLSTYGGLVWIKARTAVDNHWLSNTVTGITTNLSSNLTAAQASNSIVPSVSTTGYVDGTGYGSSNLEVSWTFRKQPKFFDIQTWSGNSTAGRAISHNLGSTPGCIMIKSTTRVSDWVVYHRSIGTSETLILNSTVASANYGNNISSVTSTSFNITSGSDSNASGDSYVAFIFAHNSGGFGLTGTDNVISCGTFDANLGEVINLGYEPQWLLYRDSSSVNNWRLADIMRGFINLPGTNAQTIQQSTPNTTAADASNSGPVLTSTGFTWNQSGGGNKYIYIAIRRGPMKVPSTGTSVFYPLARTGTGTATSISGVGFVPDFFLSQNRNVPGDPGPASSLSIVLSRITNLKFLRTQTTSAETDSTEVTRWNQSGVSLSADTYGRVNDTSVNTINYFMGRAPSFMDVTCYTGTGTQGTIINHNLTVPPTLVIIKGRNQSGYEWVVLSTDAPDANGLFTGLNTNTQGYSRTGNFDFFGNSSSVYTAPTATTISLGNSVWVNNSGSTYNAYSFASCPGVSKTGSYTGTGTTLQINCGFTSGSRFVLIKRADSTGDWFFWDSARGIVAGNDPYLLFNGTAAEVTSTDYVDTYSAGFEISSTAPSSINASGGSFIFLAIA